MNYQSKRWERTRQAVLRRDDYLCRECKRYGVGAEAREVHHILPAEECTGRYARLLYDSRNLISLCSRCHGMMHVRWRKELSEKGFALLKRSGVLDIPPLFDF